MVALVEFLLESSSTVAELSSVAPVSSVVVDSSIAGVSFVVFGSLTNNSNFQIEVTNFQSLHVSR